MSVNYLLSVVGSESAQQSEVRGRCANGARKQSRCGNQGCCESHKRSNTWTTSSRSAHCVRGYFRESWTLYGSGAPCVSPLRPWMHSSSAAGWRSEQICSPPSLCRRERLKANGKAAPMSVTVSLEAPRPLLNEGPYLATCTEATCAWSRRWSKWICRLVMEPVNYTGRPYTGSLCKFLQLGSNPK